jgi:hypothetical protein
LPRRRPPVDIFTFPLPDRYARIEATCPQCAGVGRPIGHVGLRLVFRCEACGVRFKIGAKNAEDRGGNHVTSRNRDFT